MIRVTLDVNVLASGFPAESGPPAALIDAWTALAYELIISEHILAGLERTWQKPYYQHRFTPEQVHDSLSALRTEATLVTPASTVHGVIILSPRQFLTILEENELGTGDL